jgi:hypothetical protein
MFTIPVRHTDHIAFARELLVDGIKSLYVEDSDLVGFGAEAAPAGRHLRANERAVGARLAVHVDRALAKAESALTVDVEYSRILLGVAQKKGLGQLTRAALGL